jgi:ring-1,2-phenylacetyl-CoA epoxidase subunit PaaD
MVAAVAQEDTSRIWQLLEQVPDPEIPVISIVDLGIVREVTPDRVLITPTYTGCPASLVIERSVRTALDEAGYSHVAIETTLAPPWTTDWISDEGKRKLRAYGIAPPTESGRAPGALPAMRVIGYGRDQPLRLHALQGAVALPCLCRALRPFQVPLNVRFLPPAHHC